MGKQKRGPIKGIQVKSRKEIAEEYGVSIRTLYRWLKREKISVPPGLLNPKTIRDIYKKFGRP